MSLKHENFYNEMYLSNEYATGIEGRNEEEALKMFIENYGLKDKKVLEIGCGRGAFQNLVEDYTGVDIALSVQKYINKKFVNASVDNLPFENETFDAIWSIAALEHVANPEKALKEIARVLKPSGVVYLAPAWHVRSWASEGYHVRPWSNFGFKGKIIKASIFFRNLLWYRALFALPFRSIREIQYCLGSRKPTKFIYKCLKPNYEKYWCADSDACNSMDPHEMLLWFKSRGWLLESHKTLLKRFLVRHGAIIVKKL